MKWLGKCNFYTLFVQTISYTVLYTVETKFNVGSTVKWRAIIQPWVPVIPAGQLTSTHTRTRAGKTRLPVRVWATHAVAYSQLVLTPHADIFYSTVYKLVITSNICVLFYPFPFISNLTLSTGIESGS